MRTDTSIPRAIVLGLADTGYGIARALAERGVPVIAFEKDPSRPEVRTSLCQEVITYRSDDDLQAKLVARCDALAEQPVLLLGGDGLVKFYNDRRPDLEGRVRIDFPSREVVDILLEKTRFSEFARQHGFRIPSTHVVHDHRSLEVGLDELDFPCVVKPAWRNAAWKTARFPKVFVFQTRASLLARIGAILDVTQDLVVQEWIPGSDADIFFCLTYFDSKSRCLGHFTGRKLRQWPVGTGSTACAEPADAGEVRNETIRLFETTGFAGFGSVEFKRHAKTGHYYIMEPTVGRSNHQSYVATANGVNLPAIAYQALTGVDLGLPQRSGAPVFWIDDQFDALSILVSGATGRLNVGNVLRSYFGHKSFRFMNRHDLRPLFAVYQQAPRKLWNYASASVRRRLP